MLFEELIEQHRVHLVIAYAVGLTLFIGHNQIRIHLGDLFGDQTKLRRAFCIPLVMERHRLKRQNRFTDSVHRLDLLLETALGSIGAELTVTVYIELQVRAPHIYSINAVDKRCYTINRSDPDSVVLARQTRAANVDIVTARSEIGAGERSHGDVESASDVISGVVVIERF